MEDEDKNSGKDRIRNEGQKREGGITELNSFTFAILDCDIIVIKNYLEQQDIYKYRISYENIDVESFYFDNMYLQPIKGTAKGLFYNPVIAPNFTIVLGNGWGCWGSLCNNIASNLLINNIQIQINDDDENPDQMRNQIVMREGAETIRVVQMLLGDNNKMEFVQVGTPLWFENIEYYKKRKIKDRMNKNILMEYSAKIGLDLTDNNLFKSNQKSLYVEL